MRKLMKNRQIETRIFIALAAICIFLSLATDTFLTSANLTSLLNNSSVNLIWAVGLLVVLIAGGIDISFAVATSVVQYIAAKILIGMGGGNWVLGFIVCGGVGIMLGLINAALIHGFRIISIVVTIATFNAFFGLLMFFTRGRSIYNLPDWWIERIPLYEHQAADGTWSQLMMPVAVMVVCVIATWFLIQRTNLGRQIYAFGDNPEGARRAGVNLALMQGLAFGWCGMMAGIAALMQVNIVQEVVPNALYGRELDVLAATVLGGARLGGGKGTVLGAVLGVMFVAVTQNGLNLLGISPFAFKMIIGAAILIAISTSNMNLGGLFATRKEGAK
ncbi:monosaccharide ABC transporter membrane protein (CUT2 family) [Rhodobacter aestuarii]|uniref:Monosaccharide ABC transporter membrane protein, CUT2 family n=1 Tax=Rhodobacter aestuarii TaxID=453582 RepID=A0A1N7PMV8_9RHOB|nr:ABC transporter permease [Rhodobacter aestuarii]PTV94283.1 monosaccharide ABC transporter membrane protein (CUT2 family) [Rhodobacter aestuarii]SIT11942.1 monosaccharide ABC transporter membrane protein, CUT2 family [Rhodobacter aestuarii]